MLRKEAHIQVLREIIHHSRSAQCTSEEGSVVGETCAPNFHLEKYGLGRLLSILREQPERKFLSLHLNNTKKIIHKQSNAHAHKIMANLGRLRGEMIVSDQQHQIVKGLWVESASNAVFAIDVLAWVNDIANNPTVPFELCKSEEYERLCNVIRECHCLTLLLLVETDA